MSKRKQQQKYSVESTTGEDVEFSPSFCHAFRDNDLASENMIMCPYTNLIPLQYLLSFDELVSVNDSDTASKIAWRWDLPKNTNKQAMFNKRWTGTPINMLVNRLISGTKEKTKYDVEKGIERYIDFDLMVGERIIDSFGRSGYRKSIIKGFEDKDFFRFHQRTYVGAASPYSLLLRDDRGHYHPHMMAVVIPEDYLWMKYNLLLTGKIPLDRVIILIDSALDSVEFHSQPFRKLFKELLPMVMKSSAKVFRVPMEFIKKECFMQPWSWSSNNIKERKKEKDRIIESFYDFLGKDKKQTIEDTDSLLSRLSRMSSDATFTVPTITGASAHYVGYTHEAILDSRIIPSGGLHIETGTAGNLTALYEEMVLNNAMQGAIHGTPTEADDNAREFETYLHPVDNILPY